MAVVISPSLVLAPEVTQPLTHARIGIQTFATRDNLHAASTSGLVGFPNIAATNPLTYESWMVFGVTGSDEYVLLFDRGLSPATPSWDYFAIAGHNLGSVQCTVVFSSSPIVGPGTTHKEFIPGDDSPIMLLTSDIHDRYGALTLKPLLGSLPFISVVYMGKALAMQRPIYGGHQPVTLSRVTAVRPQVSETGQWLGRSIIRKGLRTEFSWRHLTPEWYRAEFDPFVEDARKRPWFISWRPETYPDEVAYCWTPSDIRPTNMGLGDLMEVSVPVEALDVTVA